MSAPLVNELHDRRLLQLAKTVQDAVDRGDANGLTVEQMRDVLLQFPALVRQLHEGAPLMLGAAEELRRLRGEMAGVDALLDNYYDDKAGIHVPEDAIRILLNERDHLGHQASEGSEEILRLRARVAELEADGPICPVCIVRASQAAGREVAELEAGLDNETAELISAAGTPKVAALIRDHRRLAAALEACVRGWEVGENVVGPMHAAHALLRELGLR